MMKKGFIILALVLGLFVTGFSETEDDRSLFDRAKLELFDKQWLKALDGLDQLLARFPKSRFYANALFYKGKCLEELGRSSEALPVYETFMSVSPNDSLKEEATYAVIGIHFALYEKGGKGHLENIVGFLQSKDWSIRNYAAFKLSYARDKRVAALAVPVLRAIISGEKEQELTDLARIALMRIDPEYLKNLPRVKNADIHYIHITGYDKKLKKQTFALNIPFALARLALESIPDQEKKKIRDKGYDLDRILDMLVKTREILSLDAEDTIIKIWID